MASILAAKVIECIRKPSHERDEESIKSVACWFQSKVSFLEDAEYEIIHNLLKQCVLKTYKKDDIVIKEGDHGEVEFGRSSTSLYILLSGSVEIYRQNSPNEFANSAQAHRSLSGHDKTFEKAINKSSLGECIFVQKQSGAIFGERALVEDEPRSASVVAVDNVELLAIDRELYNNTIQKSVERDVNIRNTFINVYKYTSSWQKRFKKQLSMAFEYHHADYDQVICRQGRKVDKIYFLLHGEVKLSCKPDLYNVQYSSRLKDEDVHNIALIRQQYLLNHENAQEWKSNIVNELNVRKKCFKRTLDICLLNNNESIGDVEVLLKLDTYLYTAVATKSTKLFYINMKQWDRLFVKRHPISVDNMRADLCDRLKIRTQENYAEIAPFLVYLSKKVNAENLMGFTRRQISNLVGSMPSLTCLSSENQKFSSANFHLPPRGALVDMYGPGTVFDYIRKKDHKKRLQEAYQLHMERSSMTNNSKVEASQNKKTLVKQRTELGLKDSSVENNFFDKRGLIELLTNSRDDCKKNETIDEQRVEDTVLADSKTSNAENHEYLENIQEKVIEARIRNFLESTAGVLQNRTFYRMQLHPLSFSTRKVLVAKKKKKISPEIKSIEGLSSPLDVQRS